MIHVFPRDHDPVPGRLLSYTRVALPSMGSPASAAVAATAERPGPSSSPVAHLPGREMFDFGFTDVLQVNHTEHALFLVQFACGCTVVVGGGRILLWPG